jgi:hypothetical protein
MLEMIIGILIPTILMIENTIVLVVMICHLTPSDITSYDKVTNHNSFSLYNQAPQLAGFNRGKWARLENSVYDTIRK